MDDLKFYPTLTNDLLGKCGCDIEKYLFSYHANGVDTPLRQSGSSVIKLSDPLEFWKLREDGITIKKKISLAYPAFLHGPGGVACKKADIGVCIIWTNYRLTQTGHILPVFDRSTAAGRTCYFEHTFLPGEIDGDLELSLIMYIKKAAPDVDEGERGLMNEEGVSLGEIDHIVVDFDSAYMDFPIEEFSSEKEPLWWVEFSQWEDPKTIEKFDRDNICLYLNPHYPACPMTDGNIKNVDLLIEILAAAYLLIFLKLGEDDLIATRDDIELAPNSICSILHDFIGKCNVVELRFESPESLLKTLQMNIRAMLVEGSAQ